MAHGGVAAGGWLARFLRARAPSQSPLSAVALSATLPESLSGAPSAAALQSLEEFAISSKKDGGNDEAFPRELRRSELVGVTDDDEAGDSDVPEVRPGIRPGDNGLLVPQIGIGADGERHAGV